MSDKFVFGVNSIQDGHHNYLSKHKTAVTQLHMSNIHMLTAKPTKWQLPSKFLKDFFLALITLHPFPPHFFFFTCCHFSSFCASFFVSWTSGGWKAKKGNRQFAPWLFSLLIGLVFLVEQAAVHLDVTYQHQAQSWPLFSGSQLKWDEDFRGREADFLTFLSIRHNGKWHSVSHFVWLCTVFCQPIWRMWLRWEQI